MQMAMIASTIANNGVMMQPYLVSNVLNSKGAVVKTTEPEAAGTIISPDTARTMKDFMRTVVTEGTGRAANLSELISAERPVQLNMVMMDLQVLIHGL